MGMIFPMPGTEESGTGFYHLKEVYDTSELYAFYHAYKNGTGDIQTVLVEGPEKEEYTLDINENGILITASTEEGIYRAMTSLRQLLYGGVREVGFIHIIDKPDLDSRLWMLDISRGRVTKPEYIRQCIDHISEMKYNQVGLYMESFCYKYPAFPQYTKDFDCLTPEDIRELDRYCKERFVELVPMINGFGHMASWLSQPELKHLGIGDGTKETATLNPLLEESFTFVDQLMESVLPYFSSKKAHIGFDEALELGTCQTKEACETRGRSTIAMEWLWKVAALAHDKYQKEEVMVYHDMFAETPEIFTRFPDYVTVCNWNYSQTQILLIEKQCANLREYGKQFYTVGATETYGGFSCRSEQALANLRANAEFAKKYGAKGMMVTEWGDGGHPQYPVWTYLPSAAGAALAWNAGLKQETDAAYFKSEYWLAAERYADRFIFHAPVSRILTQMGNYYLLEPERIHGQTMLGLLLKMPLSQNQNFFFDLDLVGEHFYFDNVIAHMTRLIEKISVIDFEKRYKREIILNARMVILSAEYAKIKLEKQATEKKKEEIARLTDWIVTEHETLWQLTAYPNGLAISIEYIKKRQKELMQL